MTVYLLWAGRLESPEAAPVLVGAYATREGASAAAADYRRAQPGSRLRTTPEVVGA